MPPIYFGSGPNDTTIAPAALALMCIGILGMLFLPRKWVIVALLSTLLIVPAGNILVVAGSHLPPMRILSLFGCIRLVLGKLTSNDTLWVPKWSYFDSIVVFWAVWKSTAVVLLWQTPAAVNLEVGHLWGLLGMYIVLRSFIQDETDIIRVIKVFAFVAILNSAEMLWEHYRFQNLFGMYLGGGSAEPAIRDGSVRSQGVFRHAILGGTFGAALIPLLLWLWKSTKSKMLAAVAIVGSTIMVVTSASSTSVGALASAIIALCMWPMRRSMRLFRWALLLTIVSLHLVMKAPVWFLLARATAFSASTGYFRAMLIDAAVHHFSDWWLIGIYSSYDWGESMWDLSNQFVNECQTAGLLALVLFLAMLKICYSKLGDARKAIAGNRTQEWYLWMLGSAMFVHISAFFGVSYWDNMQYVWLTLLVMILVVTDSMRKRPMELTANAAPKQEEVFWGMSLSPAGRHLQAHKQLQPTNPAHDESPWSIPQQ